MYKAVLQTIAVSLVAPSFAAALLLLLASACDDGDVGGAESPADMPVESPKERHQQPADVDNGDPWLAQLDHVRFEQTAAGYVIAGYDSSDVEIGRVSVYALGPDQLRIEHIYQHPCVYSNPGADCEDVAVVTLSFAGEASDHWHDVYQTLPGAVAQQRLQAMEIVAARQPDFQESAKGFFCAFTIAASAGGCIGAITSGVIPVIPLACGSGTYIAICACRDQLEKLFPNTDFGEVCP